MNDPEIEALDNVALQYTDSLGTVWEPSPYHVDELHPNASRKVLDGIDQATKSTGNNPLGLVLQGAGGTGKTHMLGWTREQVQAVGGYFFLATVPSQQNFWDSMANAIREGLSGWVDGRTQLSVLVHDLAARADVTSRVREAVTGERAPSAADTKAFVQAVGQLDRNVGLECQDTLRALALYGSPRQDDQEIAFGYLTGIDPEPGEISHAGFRDPRPRSSARLVNEISRVLALSGPTVLAVDQIDGLINDVEQSKTESGQPAAQLVHIANSLMELYDSTRRTLTVLSCIPTSWRYIEANTIDTVPERFRTTETLRNIPSPDAARSVLRKRLEPGYALAGFEPPFPTWPVSPSALEQATDFTVRGLLRRVAQHVDRCRRDGEVTILDRLDEPVSDLADADLADDDRAEGDRGGRPAQTTAPAVPSTQATSAVSTDSSTVMPAHEPSGAALPTSVHPTLWEGQAPSEDELAELDRRFDQARSAADVHEPHDPAAEDRVLPALLRSGLRAWVVERHGDGRTYRVEEPRPEKRPSVHAQLSEILDEETERRRMWSFRGIAATHYLAAQSRMAAASSAAGLDSTAPDRKLVLLRNDSNWPGKKKTQQLRDDIARKGGLELVLTDADIRTLAALRALADERDPVWLAWLRSRRPAHRVELFARVLGAREDPAEGLGEPFAGDGTSQDSAPEASTSTSRPGPSAPEGAQRPHPEPSDAGVDTSTAMIGTTRGKPVGLELSSLRRHVLVVAGSGTGKTVLLRRLTEECALHGVSVIVLDIEGDLARLGDAWPVRPDDWQEGDDERARAYLSDVEVVVWTPGRTSGRPLSFRPLPDFGAFDDDTDQFNEAIDAAVEALAPRLFVGGNRAKAQKELAVLRESVTYFGREDRGSELEELCELMTELPPEASNFSDGPSIAAELADRLRAAKVNDRLFAGIGEPVDPALLLTPSRGMRARVSVINMSALSEQHEQPSFVNQLQMALFSWIKKNPAVDSRLGGLLVMDEAQRFVPAQGSTVSTASTLMLVNRARKYGLGLVFATQAPKGLRNQVPNSASTQFIGQLGGGAPLEAAQELARSRGSDIPNLGALNPGEFFLGVEGRPFRKIRTLMCLSHHQGPLNEDEILWRARHGRPGGDRK